MSIGLHVDPLPLRLDADGVPRVAGTRVTLETIVEHYRAGASAEEIATRFDGLNPSDVHAAIAYYLRHQEELDRHFAWAERQTVAFLQSIGEQHQPWQAIRDRLLRRVNGDNACGDQVPGG